MKEIEKIHILEKEPDIEVAGDTITISSAKEAIIVNKINEIVGAVNNLIEVKNEDIK